MPEYYFQGEWIEVDESMLAGELLERLGAREGNILLYQDDNEIFMLSAFDRVAEFMPDGAKLTFQPDPGDRIFG